MDLFKQLMKNHPSLRVCGEDLQSAKQLLLNAVRSGGKIMVCGNGGSCADSEHIVGELMKGFLLKRRMSEEEAMMFQKQYPEDGNLFVGSLQKGIPAISLGAHTALTSAYINDENPDMVYAQQVYGYGKKEDVLIAISTSGNSLNVVNAVKTANIMKISTIALTGQNQSKLSELCTCAIRVPETETYLVQELHLPVYHYLCAALERELFVK